MAKGKHAAALFEVINKGKTPGRPAAPSAVATPSWWFKRRNGQTAAPAAPPAAHAAAPARPANGLPPHASASPQPEPRADVIGRSVQVAVDSDRQQIALRLTYTTAGVIAFGLLTALALAFLAGRREPDRPVISQQPSENAQNQPAQPQVLNLANANTPRVEEPAVPVAAGTAGAAVAGTPARSGRETWNDPRQPGTLVVEDENRSVGLNYVVVQSYPQAEEKMAIEARDILVRNGINCTIERGLQGWSNTWLSVVGIRGFNRVSGSSELESYKAQIKGISDQYAPKPGSFKAFQPAVYQWRGQEKRYQ